MSLRQLERATPLVWMATTSKRQSLSRRGSQCLNPLLIVPLLQLEAQIAALNKDKNDVALRLESLNRENSSLRAQNEVWSGWECPLTYMLTVLLHRPSVHRWCHRATVRWSIERRINCGSRCGLAASFFGVCGLQCGGDVVMVGQGTAGQLGQDHA